MGWHNSMQLVGAGGGKPGAGADVPKLPAYYANLDDPRAQQISDVSLKEYLPQSSQPQRRGPGLSSGPPPFPARPPPGSEYGLAAEEPYGRGPLPAGAGALGFFLKMCEGEK